jgi:hypothetical protein
MVFVAALVLPLAALCLVSAGCGSSGDSATTSSATSTAPTRASAATAVLDMRLQIINSTDTQKQVVAAAGCIDPQGLIPVVLKPGEDVVRTGWCAVNEADVSGTLQWDCGWFGLDCKVADYKAGNPSIGWPWISVDGLRHKFSAGESCAFKFREQVVEGSRGVDLSGAKDMRLNWVNSTTLSECSSD